MGKSKKIVSGIVIVIVIILILYVVGAKTDLDSQREMLQGKVSCGGSLIPQECATFCGMDTLQMCIDRLEQYGHFP